MNLTTITTQKFSGNSSGVHFVYGEGPFSVGFIEEHDTITGLHLWLTFRGTDLDAVYVGLFHSKDAALAAIGEAITADLWPQSELQ